MNLNMLINYKTSKTCQRWEKRGNVYLWEAHLSNKVERLVISDTKKCGAQDNLPGQKKWEWNVHIRMVLLYKKELCGHLFCYAPVIWQRTDRLIGRGVLHAAIIRRAFVIFIHVDRRLIRGQESRRPVQVLVKVVLPLTGCLRNKTWIIKADGFKRDPLIHVLCAISFKSPK